jgi:hypothetical protein
MAAAQAGQSWCLNKRSALLFPGGFDTHAAA